jgi:hypothetical protein
MKQIILSNYFIVRAIEGVDKAMMICESSLVRNS